MIDRKARLLDDLGRSIRDPRVLEAFRRVPRDEFVLPEDRPFAWIDRPLGIGSGQTISQPLVVAHMTEALALDGTEKVLEVGTGSGYQAAILAELAREVWSIERDPELYRTATERLARLGYDVRCRLGDGSRGLPEEAPFDAICVAAASPGLPQPLLDQLAPFDPARGRGGRMVLPVGDRDDQTLIVVEKGEAGTVERELFPVRFVPLLGEHGW